MNAVVVVVVVAVVGAFQPPPEALIAARVHPAGAAPLSARLVDVSEPFLDAPYVLSPLGEGAGVDPDPRLRFDAFDCTTFVETAIALALANDLPDARVVLDHLRYQQGVVDYAARRHFPEAEWIPQLTKLGLLKDITREVGGKSVTSESKKLDADVWKRARHEGLPKLADERIPSGVFALDVWPLAAAAAAADRIPAGVVLHLVRVDFPNVPVRVSHQGLVLEKDGKKFIRHAADRMHHRVVDEPLDRFFQRMKAYGKWPVTGVHLTALQAPPGWRASLGLPP